MSCVIRNAANSYIYNKETALVSYPVKCWRGEVLLLQEI